MQLMISRNNKRASLRLWSRKRSFICGFAQSSSEKLHKNGKLSCVTAQIVLKILPRLTQTSNAVKLAVLTGQSAFCAGQQQAILQFV